MQARSGYCPGTDHSPSICERLAWAVDVCAASHTPLGTGEGGLERDGEIQGEAVVCPDWLGFAGIASSHVVKIAREQ
ncbi:MAG TPA: hypothetical protein VKU19_11955 [Bryobacteraceae bacterium]|nr:hypothetical protein [Bryobacteraceae bacterium]